MDSLKLIREMYDEEPDEEDPDEQRSSSPTMEPSQPSYVHVGHSPPIDAIQSIREIYQKIDPLDQIDPLFTFIKSHLHKMNNPSEAGSSSSEGWLETVSEGTKVAAKTMDTISTEAEKLSISDAVEMMGNLALKVVKGIEEMHLVFIGLSIAAFALQSYMRVSSNENECRQLLLKILELAINGKEYREQIHHTEELCNAVGTIVEGGVICCDYLKRGQTFRFWSTTTAAAQLEKTNQQLRDIRDSIQLLKYYRGDKDVFLSHSGKQKNFVRQLHRDLTREDVSCFFDEDNESLPLTQKFPSLMIKHAETCKIAVLVLSKEFLCSKWPMLELSAFIRAKNSGKNVNLFPIFFMISPNELHITKDCPEWQRLEVSNDTRAEWEAALREVRSINGVVFVENGNEVDCREKVVKNICDILVPIKLERQRQVLEFEPVDIEEAQKEVTRLLDLTEASLRVVVIYGLGGIGKTTLASAVLRSLDLTGYHYCRVDMDQDCKLGKLRAMQEEILRSLFKKNLKLDNCRHGREKLCEAFENALKPVFLFIDNALRQTDLKMLLPIEHISHLPMGSRILVTTRNLNETNICRLQQGIQFHSHRVDSVPEREAKRILCHYAVGDKNGNIDGGVNVNDLMRICGGIPLVLRIVGSHVGTQILRREGNAVSACNEMVQYYMEWQREGFEGGEDVSEPIVGFVYKGLKEPCKQAFLDIAFFFNGWERSKVADIVGEVQLEDLELAALVTTPEAEWEMNKRVKKTVVKMHDIVTAIGKKLSEGTRITDTQSLSILLGNKKKLQPIKGIWLRNGYGELSLEAKHVDSISTSVRVLSLGRPTRLNGRCFPELRFLDISYEDMLPLDLSKASRLSYFQGHIIKGQRMSEAKFTLDLPKSLRLLYLDAPRDSPVSLDINGHLTLVREISLLNITIDNFEANIKLGNFSCLKILNIDACSRLERLPESFGNLSCLQTLDMINCSMLERLPQSFGNLSCLKRFVILNCSKLQGLPQTFDQLSCLQELKIDLCERMSSLSDNFGQLKWLKLLSICNCKELKRLPDDIIGLTSLAAIKAYGCPELEAKAMDSLVEIRSLMFLDIDKSYMLIKRWKEIQQDPPPIGLPLRVESYHRLYEETVSAMFFSNGSTFLHIDGDGHMAEVTSLSLFTDAEVKVCLLLTACALSEELKQKLVEVASQEFQIIYVDVDMEEREAEGSSWMEERDKRIRETLLQLPEGSRAWTCRFYKTRVLFAYSLWEFTGRVNTSIVGTTVVVDEEGRRKLSHPLKKIFERDSCDSSGMELRTLFNPLSEAYNWMRNSPTKIVLKVDLHCEKYKRRAMKTVAGVPGVNSVQVDSKDNKITVIGDADPVEITIKLRKFGYYEIARVGRVKEEFRW